MQISRLATVVARALVAVTVLVAGCSTAGSQQQHPAAHPDRRRPELGTPYGEGWSAVHADAANTDHSPVEGPADVALAWQRSFDGSMRLGALEWTINLGPTVEPRRPAGRGDHSDGDQGQGDQRQIYLTSTVTGCHLQALDTATGETRWCADDLDVFTVSSSPVIDRQGHLYVADGRAMHALDRDGRELWQASIEGVPLSAQLTPEGRVVFVTHVGTVYVLDRRTGEPVLDPVELVPGATWDPADGMAACARGTEECPSANTPAVDLATGRLFFTFWAPGAPRAGVRAMRYTEDPEPALTPLWTNDDLPGGSGSSPDLSADGSRLYVTDNDGALHALDAATGEEVWSFPIGFASGGSVSTSPDGLIMPAGGPLQAIRDEGDRARLAWRRDDLTSRGIATQAAGGKAYAVISTGGAGNDLVVVDTATGAELDRDPMPGASVFGVGTTVGLDGTVYVPTIVGELYAFRPAGAVRRPSDRD